MIQEKIIVVADSFSWEQWVLGIVGAVIAALIGILIRRRMK